MEMTSSSLLLLGGGDNVGDDAAIAIDDTDALADT
jgi:hypothetical protein